MMASRAPRTERRRVPLLPLAGLLALFALALLLDLPAGVVAAGSSSTTVTRKSSTTKKVVPTTTTRALVNGTTHSIDLPCKSGVYDFTQDTVALYEDEFDAQKTEWIPTWNGLGKNVILNAGGSMDLKLLRL